MTDPVIVDVASITWENLPAAVVAMCVIYGLHFVWTRLEVLFPPVDDSQ